MMLAETFLEILDDWRPAFPQQRTHLRAARQAVGSLVALGRRTVTRILWCLGREQHDWTAEYRLFSQAPWQTQDLFALDEAPPFTAVLDQPAIWSALPTRVSASAFVPAA